MIKKQPLFRQPKENPEQLHFYVCVLVCCLGAASLLRQQTKCALTDCLCSCRMNTMKPRDMGDSSGGSDLFMEGTPPAVILCYPVALLCCYIPSSAWTSFSWSIPASSGRLGVKGSADGTSWRTYLSPSESEHPTLWGYISFVIP